MATLSTPSPENTKLSDIIKYCKPLSDFRKKTGYGTFPDPGFFEKSDSPANQLFRFCMYLELVMYEVEDGVITLDTARKKLDAINNILRFSAQSQFLIDPIAYCLSDTKCDQSNTAAASEAFAEWLIESDLPDYECANMGKLLYLQTCYGLRTIDCCSMEFSEDDLEADTLSLVNRKILPRKQILANLNAMYAILFTFILDEELPFVFHGERHFYAHNLYYEMWRKESGVGLDCPVVLDLTPKDWLSYASETAVMETDEVLKIDKRIRHDLQLSLHIKNASCVANYLGNSA